MRATTLLSRVLEMKHTRVRAVTFGADGLVLDVAPTTRVPRCSGCGAPVHKVHDRRVRSWRHLDLAGVRVTLRYAVRRPVCARCGVQTEWVPWAALGVWFTYEFEEAVAYLAQHTDQRAVATLTHTRWETVRVLIARVVARHRPVDWLDDLTEIGVDEVSYRRGHHYLTVVTDHRRGRVVWVAPGHDAATLAQFFEALGPSRIARLVAITLDLSGAYRAAIDAAAPHLRQIYDRFHVERLAHDALDAVRRAQVRRHRGTAHGRWLKKTRTALHKKPCHLTPTEAMTLAQVELVNRPLYRAYLLKERLADLLDGHQVHVARGRLAAWIRSAQRSKLAAFQRVAKTIGEHREGILAYVASGLTNALAEGINLKIRVLAYRGYGFHDPHSLIAWIILCCGGIDLAPPQKPPPRFH